MLKMTIHNKVEEMTALEPFMDSVSEELSIAPDTIFQLNLALDEAMANSVNYAYPEDTVGEITLQASREGDAITFQLIDAGKPFDPTAEKPEVDTTLSAEDRSIGGLGIFLIQQMMDSVSYQRQGSLNILTMVKSLKTNE